MFKSITPQVDFPKMERDLLKKWYEKGVVKKYLQKNNAAREKFSFLDGPITANNPMGVHHAWGRTYKDLWQRFFNMLGRKQRFQNGFDEQGLWVEVEVEKELGLKNKRDIENLVPGDTFKSLEKFIRLCKERVKKYSEVQTEQSKRLGYFMDWDNSYHTSSDENNYAIWHFLKTVHQKGWLYKGRDSVPWCPRCGTAISQHEILTEEYKELTHTTVVFKLPILGRTKEYLLAWTTTPWTIPGNVALAVDEKLSYWKMENSEGEKIYIISPEVLKNVEKEATLIHKEKLLDGFEKKEELKGSELVGLKYEGPYDDLPAVKKALGEYIHRVIATDTRILEINPAEGTGIVHIAPGAGTEDFALGKKERLPVIAEIDEGGVFLNDFGFLSNKNIKKAIAEIVEDLQNRGLVFRSFAYSHRYPTCWRCKTELVWRVVDEWYISMDKKFEGKTFREGMIDVTKTINWLPNFGLERELDWLGNMHDWLISKKRYWGLALPIWECQNCGKFQVIGSKEELRKKATEWWDKFSGNSPHRPWIDEIKIICSCGSLSSRIPDVGNPWLDAGIVPFSTLPKEFFPADFITESFPGQFKNWFYSLIAMSTALVDTKPFKTVLGFASVRDEKGEEMHKSKGNAIEFNEAADKIGVDIMRWLYTRTNPEHNVNFGYQVTDEIRRWFHLRLWNSYAFFIMYANVDKWKPQKDPFRPTHVLDRWILSRMHGNVKNITVGLINYNAHDAAGQAEIFVINDLSTWYVRRIRDRVGPSVVDSKDKQDAYHTLWIVLTTYSKVLAPFIPFISDEIYSNLTGEESVHLADWPRVDESLRDENLEKEMEFAREVVEAVHAKRKEAKIKVRQPLKSLKISGPGELSKEVLHVISQEVNVKNVYFEKGPSLQIKLDFAITLDLKLEGETREIIRQIQDERKKIGTALDEKVRVTLLSFPKKYEDEIKRKALVETITKGDRFSVSRL